MVNIVCSGRNRRINKIDIMFTNGARQRGNGCSSCLGSRFRSRGEA